MKILVLDNYDSFTYNLVHALRKLTGDTVDVFRNDEISLDKVDEYNKIVLSPGPGVPADAGIMLDLIKRYAKTKSILGVCLGHQAIGQAFGAELINLPDVYHGVATDVKILKQQDPLFKDIPACIKAGRYHSWIVSNKGLPSCFEITAVDDEGQIMAISHKQYDVKGLQFHPESVLTEQGEKIIENWLNS